MLLDLLNHRRAVRHFDADKPLDSTTVRHCLEQAQLAPSSSNLQLYEFYHITGKATLEALATACLSQQAATTATQMVVFVCRQDLYRQRTQAMFALESENLHRHSPPDKLEKRLKANAGYYGKFLPFPICARLRPAGTAAQSAIRHGGTLPPDVPRLQRGGYARGCP